MNEQNKEKYITKHKWSAGLCIPISGKMQIKPQQMSPHTLWSLLSKRQAIGNATEDVEKRVLYASIKRVLYTASGNGKTAATIENSMEMA